jgi:hypothetical protein
MCPSEKADLNRSIKTGFPATGISFNQMQLYVENINFCLIFHVAIVSKCSFRRTSVIPRRMEDSAIEWRSGKNYGAAGWPVGKTLQVPAAKLKHSRDTS